MIFRLISAVLSLALGSPPKRETPAPTPSVPAVKLAEELTLVSEDDEITEWMPRLDIDLRDHSVIETIECGDCKNVESFVMTMADESVAKCPACKSRAVFIHREHMNLKKPLPASVSSAKPDTFNPWNDDDTEPLF